MKHESGQDKYAISSTEENTKNASTTVGLDEKNWNIPKNYAMNIDAWKDILADTLKSTGLIADKFSGEITIVINQGGIRHIRKTEFFK
jgi:hypothetical protein